MVFTFLCIYVRFSRKLLISIPFLDIKKYLLNLLKIYIHSSVLFTHNACPRDCFETSMLAQNHNLRNRHLQLRKLVITKFSQIQTLSYLSKWSIKILKFVHFDNRRSIFPCLLRKMAYCPNVLLCLSNNYGKNTEF